MCGINGIFAFGASAEPVRPALIEKMRDSMAHRGPDGAGLWMADDRKIGFGHRRLSILDLSEQANQPMQDGSGRVCLVYNGEIYNHADIRAELEAAGHVFKTHHSDTEVLLRAYLEWGRDCLHRLRGIFAFALWDAQERSLWLVRDRIGVKPLYVTLQNGSLAFASEIKALLLIPGLERAVDHEALFHYLTFLVAPAPQTLFKGIEKLPAGSWMLIDSSGNVTRQRWWDALDNIQPRQDADEDALSQELLSLLRETVQLRRVSDVPVGVFLSGGIDSSTNAALFSESRNESVRTFSIGYEGEYGSTPDELGYARQVAEFIGADHHEIRLKRSDLTDLLPHMVWLQDEPIADPVCVPLYYVSKLARDNGVTVCQVGEGADELFWGYAGWKRALSAQNALDSAPLPNFLKRMACRLGAWLPKFRHTQTSEWLRRGAQGQPIFWGGAEAFTHADKMALLSPELRREFAGRSSWEAIAPIRARFEQKAWEKSPLQWMTYLDLNLRLPELLLMRVDKMTMGVGLEGREPFLDHKLVEFALSLPQAVKTRDGISKVLLKKAVRGIIPDAVIDRQKQGFGVPIHEWLLQDLGDYARQESIAFAEQSGLLDPDTVRRFFKQRPGDPRLWFLLNLALWWKSSIAGEHPQ